jgi:hypothetical protein
MIDMEKFDKMILNVRDSFRLLYQFNRRILDLMRYIEKKYNIPYKGGRPHFSDPSPRGGKGKLDNWAWDWLNLYFYEFFFEKKKIKLSILLQSDTGMWDADVEPLDVDKFENTENAKTKLIFVFSNCDYWDMEKVFENENFKGNYIETFEIKKNKKTIYSMIFNINEFKDKSSTDKSLHKFIQYLKKNEILDINIVDRKLSTDF